MLVGPLFHQALFRAVLRLLRLEYATSDLQRLEAYNNIDKACEPHQRWASYAKKLVYDISQNHRFR
jgi:hypothetical protein